MAAREIVKDLIFKSQKLFSCIVYTMISVLPGASSSLGYNLVLTVVSENEHDCEKIIYIFQDEESFRKQRYALLLGQRGSISFTIKARKKDLYTVSTFGIIGCIKVYRVMGIHEQSNGQVNYT